MEAVWMQVKGASEALKEEKLMLKTSTHQQNDQRDG
tara:strand:+ start:330 stop:437 length:108 start_codon:yes stop_codon:yes gene_type:complete